MIQRTLYLNQLRPFFHQDIVKVLTGLRRSGKSVLLQQVQETLLREGADPAAMLAYNFEDLRNLPLCHADALYPVGESGAVAVEEGYYHEERGLQFEQEELSLLQF